MKSAALPALFVISLPMLLATACAPGRPDVDLDTPERAAESVGRVLCAEHAARVEAARERFEDALAIQAAKAEILADASSQRAINERLQALAELFDDHDDELEACNIVLTDLVVVHKDQKVRVSLAVETQRWHWNEQSGVALSPHTQPVLLTLTRIDEAWKVTESSVDFTLPDGAIGRLLD